MCTQWWFDKSINCKVISTINQFITSNIYPFFFSWWKWFFFFFFGKNSYILISCVCACMLSCFSHVQLFATLWTVTCQTPLSMGFSRQEYWIGLPFPPPGDLPNPGIELVSLMSPALAGRFFTTRAAWEAPQPRPFSLSENSWNWEKREGRH